jgi:hypothetical protein
LLKRDLLRIRGNQKEICFSYSYIYVILLFTQKKDPSRMRRKISSKLRSFYSMLTYLYIFYILVLSLIKVRSGIVLPFYYFHACTVSIGSIFCQSSVAWPNFSHSEIRIRPTPLESKRSHVCSASILCEPSNFELIVSSPACKANTVTKSLKEPCKSPFTDNYC